MVTHSAYMPAVTDGVYEIASADHLKWYQVNLDAGLLTGRESLRLVADIDFNGATISPIGSAERPFGGKFKGEYHTLSNYKIDSDKDGGLFGVLSLGAELSALEINAATVTAEGSAGALFGAVASRAIVKIDQIVTNGVTVTSKTANAGSLGGSTDGGMAVTVANCISHKATVNGKYCGGFVGLGNAIEFSCCYVNATLNVENRAYTGSLAYYTEDFSQDSCYYVKTASFSRASGKTVAQEAFTSGEIAYLANTLSGQRLLGLEGDRVIFGNPVYSVRFGETLSYTTALLSDTGDLEVYTDGKVVAIAIKRASGPILPDLAIKLTADGKTVGVKFSELTLTRRVTLDGALYTVDSDTALYTLTLSGVTAYEIGSFSASVVTK